MSSTGRFVWYELLTDDPAAAKAFYGKVVGWGTQPFREGSRPYDIWTAGGTPLGGVMKILPDWEQAGETPHWWAHVAVDDVDAAAGRAEELGGRIRTPGTDIPDVGRFAVITDPQGALISLLAAKGEPVAPDRMQPGLISWHELHTTDHRAAWRFYSELFGWRPTTALEIGEWGSYFMFRHPDDAEEASMGGMFDAAKMTETQPFWLYYINVGEVDGAVERTRDSGGQVLRGPMAVPGGGRVAQCLDPQGAQFAIFGLR